MNKITIACVCRTGRNFSRENVTRLWKMVQKNLKVDHEFVCLTNEASWDNPNWRVIPLLHNLPGWWSKLELFRPGLFDGAVLYLDLDTLILKDISVLAGVVHQRPFTMLRGFNKGMLAIGDVPASGIMGFHTDLDTLSSWPEMIYNEFMKDPQGNMKNQFRRDPAALIASVRAFDQRGTKGPGGVRSPDHSRFKAGYRQEQPYRRAGGQRGDQGFIGELLGWDKIPKFQAFLPDGYIIGKREARKLSVDQEPAAHVVAWSGRPELQDAAAEYTWMKGKL